jgi:transposase
MVRRRRSSRLPSSIQQELIRQFVAGTPARSAALLTGIHRNSVTLFYHKLREIITAKLAEETPFLDSQVEVDESYFGGMRKGKRGRGAAGKVAVFGLLKRGDRVHTLMIPNARQTTLIPIIRQTVKPDSIVYTDSFKTYDVLDVSEFKHYRVNHSKRFVDTDKNNHINGIENFWSQAKRHLRKYNGIPANHFNLFLKEAEWRFNYRPINNLAKTLLEWYNNFY